MESAKKGASVPEFLSSHPADKQESKILKNYFLRQCGIIRNEVTGKMSSYRAARLPWRYYRNIAEFF